MSTPPMVYEPRLMKVRIWKRGGPFAGIPIYFKAPYGQNVNVATILTRAVARGSITRYAFGPIPARELRSDPGLRRRLERPDVALEKVGAAHQIDWSA